jgi:hypothetical protein
MESIDRPKPTPAEQHADALASAQANVSAALRVMRERRMQDPANPRPLAEIRRSLSQVVIGEAPE